MKSSVDLSRHLSLHISALKLFGIWFYVPFSLRDYRFWMMIISRIILGIAVFMIPTGSQFIYVSRLILKGNVEIQEVAGIINLILAEVLVSIRILDLFLRRNLFMKLTEQIKCEEFQYKNEEQKDILEKAIKLSRLLFWVLLVAAVLDITVHDILVPALSNFSVLPLKMDFIIFDATDERYFIYIFTYQILCRPTMMTMFVVMESLPWAAMSCAISQLDVLIYNFKNMEALVKIYTIEKQCGRNEAFKNVFKGFILHHFAIKSFIIQIQDALGGQLSSTLILSACIICTTAVQIFSVESPLKNMTEISWIFVFLFVFICNLFINCYFANEITVKGFQVSTVAYSCQWISQPTKFKKNLLIFMMKTQMPITLKAVRLVPLSLKTFTMVMNWTYKAFAVMNQMKK